MVLGSEFAPKLSEGALALQPARIPSIGITTSVEMQMAIERMLVEKFPDEVDNVFARTGTAEVATDPMGPNVSDTYIMLKPREGWKRAGTQEELAEAIEGELRHLPGQSFEFSQPIELRFNELISGVRSDVAVKVFGDDLEALRQKAGEIAGILGSVPGAADVKVEQVSGLPVLNIAVDRDALARYGLAVEEVAQIVERRRHLRLMQVESVAVRHQRHRRDAIGCACGMIEQAPGTDRSWTRRLFPPARHAVAPRLVRRRRPIVAPSW